MIDFLYFYIVQKFNLNKNPYRKDNLSNIKNYEYFNFFGGYYWVKAYE